MRRARGSGSTIISMGECAFITIGIPGARHVLVALAGYGLNIIGERQIPLGAS